MYLLPIIITHVNLPICVMLSHPYISKKYFLCPMPQTHKTLGQKSKHPDVRFHLMCDVLSRLVLDTMYPITNILSSTSYSQFILD